MGTFTEPGQRVLAFLPGKRPGSVGDLLARGLERLGAEARIFGPVADPQAALEALREFAPQVVVGLPVQMLGLARLDSNAGKSVHAALLVSDHVAGSVIRAVESAWDCRVFTHWGMTETGLGGGVECEARDGYHLREADLFVEVADPATNRPLPPSHEGEVLVTTLTRRGLPLIRYKTGDAARIIAEPCPCGSVLRRLGRVAGRIGEALPLGGGHTLSITELDETLFAAPGLLEFTATLKGKPGGGFLEVAVCTAPGKEDDAASSTVRLLDPMSRAKGLPVVVTASSNRSDRATAKRTIVDERIQRETTHG
jgi:phenylacetate-coenzyme A ligase PaaK-like adenylate-forming protein